MNHQSAKTAFDQAERFFKDAGNMSAAAESGIAASKELFMRGSAAALTEIADTAWGSTKMFNDKVVQNFTTNIEAAFDAVQAIASAKSLPEMAKLQSDYVQKFAAQVTEQSKELADLSTRASQHVFEKLQATAAKSFKTGA